MSLGNRLSDLIFEKRITQKQLSSELNIAPSTLNGYIKDYREPDIATLKKLAAYFNVSIDYLVGFQVELSKNTSVLPDSDERQLLDIYKKLDRYEKKLLIEQGKLLLKMHLEKT